MVAIAWRLSQAHSRHQDVATMSQLAFGVPDMDLSSLTSYRNIQKLFISPTMCHFLWRLLNNSLYLGQRARDYQRDIKHVPLGGPCLVHGNCLYLGHTFNPAFHPHSLPTSLSLLLLTHMNTASKIAPWPSLFGPKLPIFFKTWASSFLSLTGALSSNVYLIVTSHARPQW